MSAIKEKFLPFGDDGEPMRAAAWLGARLAAVRTILLWESLWRSFWRPLTIVGLFTALAFFDVLPRLGGWGHLLVLGVLVAAFAWTLWLGVRAISVPTDDQARRRLEVDNQLDHRPLTLLQDDLSAGRGEPGSEFLWQAHLKRTIASLGRLRMGVPRPDLARRDPVALRFAVILVLFVAVVTGYGDLSGRLVRAASPDMAMLTGATQVTVELWVTPPEYAHLSPTFIALDGPELVEGSVDTTTQPILIPAGSMIAAQVHDGRGQPVLSLGGKSWAMTARDERSWSVETIVELENGPRPVFETEIALTQGDRVLGKWPAVYIVDLAPEIAFAADPAPERGQTLSIAYQADDDFGVTQVVALIRRIDYPEQSFKLTLPAPRRGADRPVSSYHDLTSHAWAGLPVDIRLEARDALDQVGVTGFSATLLPERKFRHPVARAIVTQRKILVRDPSQQLNVARQLKALAARREAYGSDMVIFLGLTSARLRLKYNPPPMTPWRTYSLDDPYANSVEPAILEVMALLWDVALRVEDGGLSLAERRLRELQEQIQRALADRVGDEELAQLLEQLREALNEFFEAASERLRQALENGELPENLAIDPETLALGQRDLEAIIERARELAEMGSTEAAAEMLKRMQQMLDSLRNGSQFSFMQPQGDNFAQELMRDLQGIIGDQQSLLDETFQRNQRQDPGQEGEDDGAQAHEEGALRQEQLRRRLGDFMQRFGEAMGGLPDELGEAEGDMRRSTDALERGRLGRSAGAQEDALEALRQGGQAAAQALAQAGQGQGQGQGFGGMFGFGPPSLWDFGSTQLDPLGRPLEGNRGFATDGVEVPDESEVQRARQILEELRARAGERGRPTDELDYIDRLLRRF